jgi:hypothetical protein
MHCRKCDIVARIIPSQMREIAHDNHLPDATSPFRINRSDPD